MKMNVKVIEKRERKEIAHTYYLIEVQRKMTDNVVWDTMTIEVSKEGFNKIRVGEELELALIRNGCEKT